MNKEIKNSVSRAATKPEERPVVNIRPSRGLKFLNIRELWAYRELLFFFIWRDVKVRYKQTILGAAWAIIQPFLAMVVFTIFFGRLAGLEDRVSGDIPYPIFVYCAMVVWTYFSHALTQSSNSLVEQQSMITKVYLPRVLIPAASVLSGLVDFAIAFTVLIGMMIFYGIVPTAAIWTVPLFTLLATFTALGVTLWLSALNVQYRDIRYVIPFLAQFWLFATPIVYPSTLVPEGWRAVFGLNPMAGVVEGFRWALLGTDPGPGPLLWVSVSVVVVLVLGGLFYFQRMEKTFADVV